MGRRKKNTRQRMDTPHPRKMSELIWEFAADVIRAGDSPEERQFVRKQRRAGQFSIMPDLLPVSPTRDTPPTSLIVTYPCLVPLLLPAATD